MISRNNIQNVHTGNGSPHLFNNPDLCVAAEVISDH